MNYRLSALPQELLESARALLPMLNLEESEAGVPVYAKEVEGDPSITQTETEVTVCYAKKAQFFRMLSFLGSTLIGETYTEHPRHSNLCYMADQSRNAVMTVEAAKKMIRALALMGFEELQLYTEDTYEIEAEPYFGHLRGRWSKEELKDLVAYGEQFGITLVPCIQTLAHLERIFLWPHFKPIQDKSSVMLVGEEKTYALIEEMFKTCAEVFKTRKINIGMDEAHDLGIGAYMKRNGYVPRTEIMKAHLAKVVEIAKKYGFQPMMWSDMYFRMTFGGYYVNQGEFPQEVPDIVPPEVTLVYWDYYTVNRDRLDHMVKLHRSFNNPTAFAGGCQKWGDFAAANKLTIDIEAMHIDACLEHGITDIWTTGWGDDGAEAAHFSILPGLMLYAEKCYKAEMPENWLRTRFEEVFKIPLEAFDLMSDVNYPEKPVEELRVHQHFSKIILYADLLNGEFDRHLDPEAFPAYYSDLAEKMLPYVENPAFGYIVAPIQKLAEICAVKSRLPFAIADAYEKKDRAALGRIAEEEIPALIQLVDEMLKAQEAMWLTESRPFGLEVQQIRFGGLKQRLSSIADTLMRYAEGKTDRIEELEVPRLYADCRTEEDAPLYPKRVNWSSIVSVNQLLMH